MKLESCSNICNYHGQKSKTFSAIQMRNKTIHTKDMKGVLKTNVRVFLVVKGP